jgi:transcriptional regulator with XRE-family HTH domain
MVRFGNGHWQVPIRAIECTSRPKIVHWGEAGSLGGTGRKLPGTGSPTVPRLELGKHLRRLRVEQGLTVQQVAAHLEFSASKVSRLETGQRGAAGRDIRAMCDLYGVEDELRQQLVDLAAKGKQHAWWQTLDLPYTEYLGLEADATVISDFALGVLPGLLQTADYARAVLRAMHPPHAEDVIDQRVAGRLDRQRQLEERLRANPRRKFRALIDEAALHRVAGSPRVMRAQLQRLLDASRLAGVSIRVLPFGVGVLPVTNNKFIILEFDERSLDAVVFIEGMHRNLYLRRPGEIAMYQGSFVVMRDMAATEDESRSLISGIADSLR